ncbi:MAG: response regulator [Bacteroidota bacterium]
MKKKKILLVDDDMDVITVVQTILENENFEVISATNKNEGIEKAKTEKPDLAILDVMMTTHYEGFELAKAFNDNSELKSIPKLMQTSIDVFSSADQDAMNFARMYRKNPDFKEMDVLLVEDTKREKAGIDYKNEEGKIVWVPVDGFIAKPVNSKILLPEIHRLLS